MAETAPMTIAERRKYLHKMRIRYWCARQKSERSRLLDEMGQVAGLHRKSLTRLINGELARKPRRRQRGKTYGLAVDSVLSKIAQSLDYPCAERLKPNLLWMAEHLKANGELQLSAEVREQLGRIRVSSLRRHLPASERTVGRIAHRKNPPQSTFAQKQGIPMRRIDWKVHAQLSRSRPDHKNDNCFVEQKMCANPCSTPRPSESEREQRLPPTRLR